MNIVNFSITEPLERKINQIIKEWGFASKAEFFRFIALSFIEREERRKIREDQELAHYSERLEKALEKKIKNKEIPSFEEQIEDLL